MSKNKKKTLPYEDRCRLVLIIPSTPDASNLTSDALSGGDVASIIIPMGAMELGEYQDHVESITLIAQEKDVAVIIECDSQVMGRSGADGMFIPSGLEALKDAVARFSPKRLVGYGGIKTRHQTMEAAEFNPDFLFFGKVDGDIRPEAHPKNMKLGSWCAQVMRISAIVMGGSKLESVVEVAQSGAEFVALSLGVFSFPEGAGAAVAKANELLDAHAPKFSDDE
jgi:thiamine-phosphate pyrophosphorylase